jgi:hypothetical protein
LSTASADMHASARSGPHLGYCLIWPPPCHLEGIFGPKSSKNAGQIFWVLAAHQFAVNGIQNTLMYQNCHQTVANRAGNLTEILTEHYRRAHPEARPRIPVTGSGDPALQ